MIPRSLKASSTGLQKAHSAFIKTGLTQEEFAKSLNLCRSTIANFLAGKSIDRSGFFQICKGLRLNPDEIFEPISTLQINKLANLKQWILNEYCHVVAFLEIANNSYLVVQINEEFEEAITQELFKYISLNNLQKSQSLFLTNILNYLNEIKSQQPLLHSIETNHYRVKLSRWFQNAFEAGWQTVEDFLSERQSNLTVNFRSSYKVEPTEIKCVKMVKLIDLGIKLRGQSVALVVALTPETGQNIGIRLQLHPLDNQNFLPMGIQLIVLDKSGQTFIDAQARKSDNWIQLEINGEDGDIFSVKVALDDYSITEDFVI